ncbi:hypothetical protein [Propionivibrio limicola]|uniref:hypothetical protein n=1 Tax=Propionivibrio limicola TaxID=167645 RepID=UPI001290AE9B|nr:hypothetical protein [Propionivibrio limicola]
MSSFDVLLGKIKSRVARWIGVNSCSDNRAGRFVVVIECILNQNARDRGAARFPAMNGEVVGLCQKYQVGMLQMPCPEVAALGASRQRKPGQSLREAMDTVHGRACCRRIAADVADRVEVQLAGGNTLLAVLGGNHQSPGCAVHNGETIPSPDSGLLIQALQSEFGARGLNVPFRGIRDNDPLTLADDLAWLQGVFAQTVADR